MRIDLFAASAALAVVAAAAHAAPAPAAYAPVSPQMVNRIADEGFNHGQVVETIEYLTDRIGGRLTGSPALKQAETWAQSRFRDWGLKNVRAEPFDFGRGWWIEGSSVRMVQPRPLQLRAIPVAWTPPTSGPIAGPVIVAPMRSEADFARWKGKLKGKVVLLSPPTEPRDATLPAFRRYTDAELAKLDEYPIPRYDPEATERNAKRRGFAGKRDAFLKEEGAIAYATMSRDDGGLVHGDGAGQGYRVGMTPPLPGVEIASEDYRRLARLAKGGDVTLEIDSRVHYDDSDHNAHNLFAEIPGRDPKAGYVMAGAHFDSWVAADGAADNGAGSAVVMEAARILSALNVHPKRTIRFALWEGEEQGLLGSAAYADKYLAKRPPLKDQPGYFAPTWPVTAQPGYGELAAYFNLDNGSGKIRGIYTEGNFAVVPIFKDWLAPFASLGASTVVAQSTGSTDHVMMSRVGLPAFQFIQDPLDYMGTVHHTNLDTFDHLRPDDLRQAAVIMATMLLDAAEADQPLPGKGVPKEPAKTDPFAYADPASN